MECPFISAENDALRTSSGKRSGCAKAHANLGSCASERLPTVSKPSSLAIVGRVETNSNGARVRTPPPVIVHRIAKVRIAALLMTTALVVSVVGHVSAADVGAQHNPPLVIRGTAFDSLRNAPLDGALITATRAGATHSATSDSLGHFQLALDTGSYIVSLQHANIDSLGLTGVSRLFVARSADDLLVVAVPSFATMWRSACGATPAPKDSGFVFGNVTEADGRTHARNAKVHVAWFDFGISRARKKELTQQRWGGAVETEANGSYAICGIPVDKPMRMRAGRDSVSTNPIDVISSVTRVQRRDFVLPAAGNGSLRGAVSGVLTTATGEALANASVTATGALEARTDSLGRFLLRDVPVGTQQIDVRSIGLTPQSVVVDVTTNDTAFVAMRVNKVQLLETVKTEASAVRLRYMADFEQRQRAGWGKYLDSTALGRFNIMPSVYAQFPSTIIQKGMLYLPGNPVRGPCLAGVMIDGRRADQDELQMFRPSDLAAVELYTREQYVPSELMKSTRGGGGGCGLIVVWTKAAWP